MQTGAFSAVVLAAILLIGGCLGLNSPETSPPDESVTPTTSPAPEPTLTPTPAATLAPVTSLPSVPECLTDAVPRPEPVDGVDPSAYPESPADVTRASLVNWTQDFEIAYFRNAMLAEEPGDDEYNLTEASASAEVRGVTHTTRGYVLRLSDFGATNYASGLHGDHAMDVGYVINETHVVRVPLDDREDPVRVSEGTVVVSCR